jgi:phosphohistidine phosphatase SixA
MRTPRFPAILISLVCLFTLVTAAHAALFAPDGAGGSANDSCTVVVAVRHAEKANGDDPSLTEAGHARAKALADALAHAHVQAILVSPTKRAQETAAPTAAHAKVEPTVVPMEGGSDAHVAALIKAVRAEAGKTVLVVGHSNTIPPLLRGLGLTASEMGDKEYGELLVAMLCPGEDPQEQRQGHERPGQSRRQPILEERAHQVVPDEAALVGGPLGAQP